MIDRFSRTKLLFGAEAMEKLAHCRVAVFGIGGVGGSVAEALVRSGVGAIDLIDKDDVSETNINRQLFATTSSVGRDKVDVGKERLLDINPECQVTTHKTFFTKENSSDFDFSQFDYVVDAIDTVSAKLELIVKCKEVGTPIICAMGAGNKVDPTAFEVTDIYSTRVCPLARVMRNELRKRGVESLKVVYSREKAITPESQDGYGEETVRRALPGSVSFVPPVVGYILAGEVIKDLVGVKAQFVD